MNKSNIKLLTTIVDRGQGEKIAAICRRQQLTFHLVCLGLGTASSEILDWFGLGETDKDVVLTLASSQKVSAMLSIFSDELHIKRPGKGSPSRSHCPALPAPYSRLCQKNPHHSKRKEPLWKSLSNLNLSSPSSTQGTVIRLSPRPEAPGLPAEPPFTPRDVSHESAEKFFGISIQQEREIVAILIKKEIKQAVMPGNQSGRRLQTPAKGLIFALPVDDLIGLTLK